LEIPVDHQAETGERLPENPKRIWLAPRCNIDERSWCEDNQGCCDDCGEPTVEYQRADLVVAEIASLRAALKPIALMPIWRDTYPDGPDIMDTHLMGITPDQVREARRLCADEQTAGTKNG
jgi:hypothetical protein